MSTPAGPGWYDDPDDPLLLRYFDGVVWSAHTTPRRSPTADASRIGRAPDVRPASVPSPSGATPRPATYAPGAGGWTTRSDVLPDGDVLAQWWQRLLARIVDVVIIGVLSAIVAWPWLGQAFTLMGDFLQESVEAGSGGAEPDIVAFQAEFVDALLPVVIASLVVSVVYEVVFLVWRSATPGKMLFGTMVRRTGGRGRLTVVDALKRQAIEVATGILGFVPVISIFASMISVLDPAWLLWDPRRQALHDKVADTVVVLRTRPPA
ncbi:MAG: RDD family protein [Ornithinibacter sp.]